MNRVGLTTIVLICLFFVPMAGCSKAEDLVSKIMAMAGQKKEQKVSLTKPEGKGVKTKPLPKGLEFVGEEFEGMDLDVNADVVTVVNGSSTDYDRTVELAHPEIIAMIDRKKQKYTKITADSAVVHPSDKRMDFSRNVHVEGPSGEIIDSDTLSWHYSQDYMIVDGPYTLEDGSGIIGGKWLKTDIAFTFMDVK